MSIGDRYDHGIQLAERSASTLTHVREQIPYDKKLWSLNFVF